MFLGPMVLDGDTPLDLYVFLCNFLNMNNFVLVSYLKIHMNIVSKHV